MRAGQAALVAFRIYHTLREGGGGRTPVKYRGRQSAHNREGVRARVMITHYNPMGIRQPTFGGDRQESKERKNLTKGRKGHNVHRE